MRALLLACVLLASAVLGKPVADGPVVLQAQSATSQPAAQPASAAVQTQQDAPASPAPAAPPPKVVFTFSQLMKQIREAMTPDTAVTTDPNDKDPEMSDMKVLEKGEQMMGLDSTGPPQDRAIALWRALGLDNDHAKDAKRKAELEAPADGEDEVMSQGHRLISEAFEHGGYAA